MRTSSCMLTSGKLTGVLVLETDDFPVSEAEVIFRAHQSESFVDERDTVGYFVVRFPGSDENREVTESALRESVRQLNAKAKSI